MQKDKHIILNRRVNLFSNKLQINCSVALCKKEAKKDSYLKVKKTLFVTGLSAKTNEGNFQILWLFLKTDFYMCN